MIETEKARLDVRDRERSEVESYLYECNSYGDFCRERGLPVEAVPQYWLYQEGPSPPESSQEPAVEKDRGLGY